MVPGLLKHKMCICITFCCLVSVHPFAQTQITLPSQTSSTQGFSHGYWFEAPEDLTISGLQTVLDAGGGPQYIQLFKINAVMPVAKVFPTTNFDLLHQIYGGPFNQFNAVNIKVKQGDKIGVLGSAGIDVSLGSGPHSTYILGHSVTLQQLGSTGYVHSGPGISSLWGSGKGQPGNIGRVKVFWSTTKKVPDDVGIARLDSPYVFCEGFHDVKFTLKNYGNNQVDSLQVHWSLNKVVQQTLYFEQLLDTVGGQNNHELSINLGTLFFSSSKKDTIKVWTSLPNGNTDTVNYNDTVTRILYPSLSGNYVINPSSASNADYHSLTEAINELNNVGICGPVTFLVKSTMYNEQIALGPIHGSGPNNPILFKKDGAGSFAMMQFSARSHDENYLISFNGTEYVTFEGFRLMPMGSSYSTAVVFNDFSSNILFDNCWFISSSSSGNVSNTLITSNGIHCDSLKISNSQFQGGTYSVYGSASKSNPSTNFSLVNNDFTNFRSCAIRLRYQHQFNVEGNTFKTVWSNSEHCFRVDYCNSYSFTRNHVKHAALRPLQFFKCSGNLQNYSLIANNNIYNGDGTGSTNGIYIEGDYTRVVHNTIVIERAMNTGFHAIHIKGGISDVLNNLIVATGGHPTIPLLKYEGLFSVTTSDYNNIYSFDSTGFAEYDMNYNNLNNWQNGTGFDIHSTQFNPGFLSFDSLRHCLDSLDNSGTPLSYIVQDIDGDLRDSLAPDIGADEWIGYNGFFLGDDQYICHDSIYIGNTSRKADFTWLSGDTGSPILIGEPGIYPVEITSQCGLNFNDTIQVFDDVPVANFTTTRSFNTLTFHNSSMNADSYFWEFGDGTFSTYKNPSHVFQDSNFDVCLSAINECDSVVHCKTYSLVDIGINEELADISNMYPNPVNELLTVEFTRELHSIESVLIYALTGELVHDVTWVEASNRLEVNFADVLPGMYFIKISTNDQWITRRLVKH